MLNCNVKRIDPRWILILILTIIALVGLARNLTSRVWCVENEGIMPLSATSGYWIKGSPAGLKEIEKKYENEEMANSYEEGMAWVNQKIMETGQKPSNYEIKMYVSNGYTDRYQITSQEDWDKYFKPYVWSYLSFYIEETEGVIYTKNLIFKNNEYITETFHIECESGTYTEVIDIVEQKLEEVYKTVEYKVTDEKGNAVGRFYSAEKDGDCYIEIVDYTIFKEYTKEEFQGEVLNNLQNIEKIIMCIAILLGIIFLYNFTSRMLG